MGEAFDVVSVVVVSIAVVFLIVYPLVQLTRIADALDRATDEEKPEDDD